MKLFDRIWPWSEIADLKAANEEKSEQIMAMVKKIGELAFHLWRRDPKLVQAMGIIIHHEGLDETNAKGYDA